MTAELRLKRFGAIAGIGLICLSASFNEAAARDPHLEAGASPAPTPDVTADSNTPANSNTDNNNPDSTASRPLVVQLEMAFQDLMQQFRLRQRTQETDAAFDARIQPKIDALKTMLEGSHNLSQEQRNKEITPYLVPSLSLAIEANRPDLVQAFVDTGISVREKLASNNTSPMDHAIALLMRQQQSTLTHMTAAASIIKILHDAGAQLEDAEVIRESTKGDLTSYAELGINLPILNALQQSGLIDADEYDTALYGSTELQETIRNMTTIDADTLQRHGVAPSTFHDAAPGGPEPYKVIKDDTLWALATRFQSVMGVDTHREALHMLATLNAITLDPETGDADRFLQIGETLQIPVIADIEVMALTPRENTTLRQIAELAKNNFHDPSLSVEEIAAELAIMNNLDIRRIDDETLLEEDRVLYAAYARDSHNQLPAMTPPAFYQGDREVDLMVIEPAGPHGKETYRVATGTAYSVNPEVELDNFHFWSEMLYALPSPEMSDMLRMLLNATDSPLQDRVVFSHSMAQRIPESRADTMRNSKTMDSIIYENIRQSLEQTDAAKPIVFTASGNFWLTDGRYIQSYQVAHSPRTVQIGSSGHYPTDIYGGSDHIISSYSSYSADICAPLPEFMGKQMEGTSFSTPLTAALYRQMSEWYGDHLSFEEIMAAAFMTASQDVLDYRHFSTLNKNPLVQPDKYETQDAAFRTNGGGIPNHERCGAGILDMDAWQNALDSLVTLKDGQDEKDSGYSMTIAAGTPSATYLDHEGEAYKYVYTLQVPADMTLGKLTFMLPQDKGQHGEIVIRTPAGFEKHLPKSLVNIVSTFAFAYEDVTEGQHIEIRTSSPLGDTAGIILRGHEPGNAIAALRDQLHEAGKLPAPNHDMAGDTVTGQSALVTLFNAPPVPVEDTTHDVADSTEDNAPTPPNAPEEAPEEAPTPALPVNPRNEVSPAPAP